MPRSTDSYKLRVDVDFGEFSVDPLIVPESLTPITYTENDYSDLDNGTDALGNQTELEADGNLDDLPEEHLSVQEAEPNQHQANLESDHSTDDPPPYSSAPVTGSLHGLLNGSSDPAAPANAKNVAVFSDPPVPPRSPPMPPLHHERQEPQASTQRPPSTQTLGTDIDWEDEEERQFWEAVERSRRTAAEEDQTRIARKKQRIQFLQAHRVQKSDTSTATTELASPQNTSLGLERSHSVRLHPPADLGASSCSGGIERAKSVSQTRPESPKKFFAVTNTKRKPTPITVNLAVPPEPTSQPNRAPPLASHSTHTSLGVEGPGRSVDTSPHQYTDMHATQHQEQNPDISKHPQLWRTNSPRNNHHSPPPTGLIWQSNRMGQASPSLVSSLRDEPSNNARSRFFSPFGRSHKTKISSSPPPIDRTSTASATLSIPDSARGRRPSNPQAKLNIRETSRTRSDASAALSSGELCDDCEFVGPLRYFCNVCKLVFCEKCWLKQVAHRKAAGYGSIPHEKTEQSVAKKVQEVLTPEWTDEDRERMHLADIDTTWFGVAREENELPLFRDYGRYAGLIADTKVMRVDSVTELSASPSQNETLYPSLVSFVGQTGAGKSTLIKLLIDLKSEDGESYRFPTPVVGAAGRDVSTSEDVHLYLDPDSSESQAPLLFADCEGLEGGERDPIGAKLKRKEEKEAKQAAAAGNKRRHRLKHTSERELVWADSPKKQSREFAVAHLYPRLLYTFSDVIVFVLKNARTAEGVLERLVDWAQAALEKSSNQPVLPHAIIALNASENNIPEELWDPETATQSLFDSLSRTVYYNPTFKRYAQFWRERNRQIETVHELLLSYYSSLRVVRIPADGRPNLIREQVEKLAGMIKGACKIARDRKFDLRMLLDADEFQPYLQIAFDHFAENLNTPFDFVQASFANSPIPNDFGGNILKLALQVMENWKDLAKGVTIFEELSYLVASCIMLDASRNKNLGTEEQIFPMYLDHLDNALENFCDRHWPCEFSDPRGGRCVNVRSGHGAKGHQSRSGKLLAAGEYVSNFSFEGHRQQFQDNTYRRLQALRSRVKTRIEEDDVSEEQAAADVHRSVVLPQFFQHASRGDTEAFISHTVCFCCLFEPPEHALPCGHILCTPCLKTFGKVHLREYVEISECPLERKERHFRKVWQVYLKPPSCGVRVLSLDGGGVRGIVELEILQLLEKELGGGIHVQSMFDLIVGTSTGGIIALGLTARNWTLDDCVNHFTSLCTKAFTLRKGMNVPGIGWLVSNYNHSIYETQPLEEALQTAFGEGQYLFGGRRSDAGSMDVKVAVTATSAAGTGVVLANYNRLCLEKLPYHFQRPEKLQGELKTWEAARATSAAPTYFKPYCHENSKHVYSDGGIYHNNPVQIADRERKLIWPAQQDEEPDVMLSIGTMYSKKVKDKRIRKFPSRGIIAHGRFLAKMAQDHLHTSLDSEKTWREYLNARSPGTAHKGRYIRINPDTEEAPPKLDEVAKMRLLQETTRHLVGSSPQIKDLARRLVASCFYFNVLGDVKEDTHRELFEVSGYFHCRFFAGPEVAELGKFIRQQAIGGHEAHFLISEEGNATNLPLEIRLDSRIINRMIDQRIFRIDKAVAITRSNKNSRTEIFLCFRRDAIFPISRFPRCLHAEKTIHTAARHVLTANNSIRWAGRTKSQQQRRHDWQPPDSDASTAKDDIITRYSDASHLLGNATPDDLMTHSSNNIPDAEPPNDPNSLRTAGLSGSYVELPTVETQNDRYYRARADWRADQSMCLSLKKGELVKIVQMKQDGWWLGHKFHDPRTGWMPSSWLIPAGNDAHRQFISSELDSKQLLRTSLGTTS